jgi:Mg/Co/Ni transporter MgtE
MHANPNSIAAQASADLRDDIHVAKLEALVAELPFADFETIISHIPYKTRDKLLLKLAEEAYCQITEGGDMDDAVSNLFSDMGTAQELIESHAGDDEYLQRLERQWRAR